MPGTSDPASALDARRRLWLRIRRVVLLLLLAWLALNLALPWFARALDDWRLFGQPLGWWLASQGLLLLYLLITVIDVVVMERLEAQYRREIEGQGPEPGDAELR